jgi:Homeodomain-like domain
MPVCSQSNQLAGFEAQLRELAAAGCQKSLQEQVSSVAKRRQLRAAMEYRPGGRRLRCRQTGSARPLGARPYGDPSGIGAQARWRPHPHSPNGHPVADRQTHADCIGRDLSVRAGDDARTTTEGIDKAKSEGRYKGRKPIEAERRHNVLKLAAEGATRPAIATQLGIGEATVYRILAVERAQHR